MRHSVGQTLTHDGCSSFSIRFAQKLHFSAVCVFGSMKSWSDGHAVMQARHPMHAAPLRSTIPSRRLKSALVGQIFMHGASSHWLHSTGKRTAACPGTCPSRPSSPSSGSRPLGCRARPCTRSCRRGSQCTWGGRSRSRNSAPERTIAQNVCHRGGTGRRIYRGFELPNPPRASTVSRVTSPGPPWSMGVRGGGQCVSDDECSRGSYRR